MNLPIYCARGKTVHLADWLVQASGRSEVVCQDHLGLSVKWAGPSARWTPVEQPPDAHTAPTQPALF